MIMQNFMPFCCGKSMEFTGILKIHVLSTMQGGQFVVSTGTLGASKQVHHWVSKECYPKGALLSIFKDFKEEGFPSHAQGKEIDSGIVA